MKSGGYFDASFAHLSMNTLLVSSDMMLAMLKLSEFQNPLTGLNFQGTGTLTTPLGANMLLMPCPFPAHTSLSASLYQPYQPPELSLSSIHDSPASLYS